MIRARPLATTALLAFALGCGTGGNPDAPGSAPGVDVGAGESDSSVLRSCQTDEGCEADERCVDGYCGPRIELVCVPSVQWCTTDHRGVATCDEQGEAFAVTPCEGRGVCVDTDGDPRCVDDLCGFAASGCLGDRVAFECVDLTRSPRVTHCGDGEVCRSGSCVDEGDPCVTDPSACEPEVARCGDGTIDATEACDDGNETNDDGCSADCQIEAGFECSGEPSDCTPIVTSGRCGDGAVDDGEGCDDGNEVSGDGCSESCQVEDGYRCTGSPSDCAPIGPVCGDGDVEDGEACDDGNLEASDGCSATCDVEDGWICRGEPSVCVSAEDFCLGVDCSEFDSVCTVGVCDLVSGECVAQAFDDGANCDDGDFCTVGDQCLSGECVSGAPRDCSALDTVCETGTCDSDAAACLAAPRPDGELCGGDSANCRPARCAGGACVATTAPDCAACGPDGDDFCAGGVCGGSPTDWFFAFDEAVTPPELVTGGDQPWAITTSDFRSWPRSVRSGPITHNQQTVLWMTVSLPRPGEVRFWHMEDTEEFYDSHAFYVDGLELGRWSGSTDWREAAFPLDAGSRELIWEYTKDGSDPGGFFPPPSSIVWVDDIRVRTLQPCPGERDFCDVGLSDGAECIVCAATDGTECAADGVCEAGVCEL